MIFAASNGHSMGQSVYKQPEQTNMSSYGTVEGKQELVKGKEIELGAFVDSVDSMETIEVLPDIKGNERLFKNKYVYLLCLKAK